MARRSAEYYGEAGFRAYSASTGGRTFDGRPMPAWSALPRRIRRAWGAAARGIINALADQISAPAAVPARARGRKR